MARKPRKPALFEPPAHGAADTAVLVRFAQDMLEAIDDWRRTQKDIPSRAESIRRFTRNALGLVVVGPLPHVRSKPSGKDRGK